MSRIDENSLLTVYIPANNRALVFRVISVVNKNYTNIDYGPIPIQKDTVMPTLDGGSVSVPEYGVMPARSYVPLERSVSFPMYGAYDEGDMWYVPETYRDRIFYVEQEITPSFLRVDLQIPRGITQGRFQKDRVVVGVDTAFGFSRGRYETVHLPKIRYGYRYANDTNVDVNTFVRFKYCECSVEIPKNPDLIFDVLTKRVNSYWVTLPINVLDASLSFLMMEVYGILGFPVYRMDQRDQAIKEYRNLITEAKV